MFKLPRGLCNHINGLLKKFWWGSKRGERKKAWVSRKIMTKPKYMGRMGFHDIEQFNLALLARQAWKILQEANSLIAHVLKSRYFPDGEFLDAPLGTNPSQVWRSIRERREVLNLGLIKRIGTGEGNQIWHHNWIPRDYKLLPICPRSANPPLLVSELIDQTTRTWNRQVLEEHFIAPDINVIPHIPLSTRLHDDFWAWHYERRGMFSVRSSYRMISGTKFQQEDWLENRTSNSNQTSMKKDWSRLWKAEVPSKVWVFVWHLAHTSLSTGSTRHEQKMATSLVCVICSATKDTWRHSLLNCRMARCVCVAPRLRENRNAPYSSPEIEMKSSRIRHSLA